MRQFIVRWPLSLCLAMGLGLSSCSSPDPAQTSTKARKTKEPTEELPNALHRLAPEFNQHWAMDTLWEDGLAEVAVYNAERVIYDEVRQFEYVQLTVKEEFNQQYKVKTDDYQRPDLFPVMKINQFCQIPTDQYPYQFLTSSFFRRENPVGLYKLTTSSQEWCGNTFKAFQDDGLQYVQTYNSYWDGQGVGRRRLRRDVLFEDALPYTLRSLRFEQLPTFKVAICELQQTSKATPPTYYNAEIQVRKAPATDAPEPAWLVQVQLAPDKTSTYWFARKYPNILLRQATWDGRNLALKKVSRYAYWTHPIPADTTQAQ